MLYLLDADVLIRADRTFYPPGNFPTFWDWLAHMGNLGNVKIPREQYEEITTGTGPLVDWLKREDVKRSLLLNEDAVPALVADVTANGYGPLDETGLEKVGKDPFHQLPPICDSRRATLRCTSRASREGTQQKKQEDSAVAADFRLAI